MVNDALHEDVHNIKLYVYLIQAHLGGLRPDLLPRSLSLNIFISFLTTLDFPSSLMPLAQLPRKILLECIRVLYNLQSLILQLRLQLFVQMVHTFK